MSRPRPDEVHGCSRYEWERIVRRVVMPGPTKAVALVLATYASQDGTSIYPGNDRLTAVTCYSDKTVRNGLEWLRSAFLIERTRNGSHLGRKALADEYRLTIPSDLLERHTLLTPDESPAPPTGDRVRSPVAPTGTPVPQDGTPVAPTKNTGSSYRPPTHHQPLPDNYQRDDHVRDETTTGDDTLAQLIEIDRAAAKRKMA